MHVDSGDSGDTAHMLSLNAHLCNKYQNLIYCSIIWALLQENLSLGCPTKPVSNQSPQLQRIARKLKFDL